MKRLGARVAAVLPLFLLAGCSSEDIGQAIEDAIVGMLEAAAKMFLIAMALMIAWAAAIAVGGALIALGVRRKKVDAGAVGLFVLGGGLIAGAWPLVFSQAGLAGVLAPGSTDDPSAGPIIIGIVAVVIAIIVALVAVRRHRRRVAAKQPTAVVPHDALLPAPPPPPLPAQRLHVRIGASPPPPPASEPLPAAASPSRAKKPAARKKAPAKATTKAPNRPRAKAGSKTR
jgi:hypothetical protein